MVVGSAGGGIMEDVVVGCGFCFFVGASLCVREVVVFCLLCLLTLTVSYLYARLFLDTWFIRLTPKDNVLTQWLQYRI